MGQRVTSLFQRPNENVQHLDIANGNAYRWPPKSGNYFGSHFIMGGERFESQQPEAFLFGENTDLNFLGNRPVPFPYPTPQLHEPTRTLRSLINIRKDSVKLVRCDLPAKKDEEQGAGDDAAKTPDPAAPNPDPAAPNPGADTEATPAAEPACNYKYNIEFNFDCDVACVITVMYFAREDMVSGAVTYTPKNATMSSQPYTYKRGANQLFTQASHVITASDFTEEEWAFDFDKEEIPIVIHCTVQSDSDHTGHSHSMFCSLEKSNDGYSIKPIKQKQCVDGVLYILQEFYGIENKETDLSKDKEDDEDDEDNTAECVICMSEIRDTLILPCRHLCLCNVCADSLRYQANNCPICRSPFRALLQLRAIRKKVARPEGENAPASDEDEFPVSQDGVPPGYEAISLIEALNGPSFAHTKSADPGQRVLSSQGSLRNSKKKKKDGKGSRATLRDKDKDKDVIIDEEKAREQAAPPDNTNSNACDAESPSPDSPGSESGDAGADSPAKVDDSNDDADSIGIPPAINDQSSSSDEETFTLSVRTQNTTLPGTPDYVLEEEQAAAELDS